MGSVKISLDDSRALSVFTWQGLLDADEMIAVITDHFPKHPTENALWDLSGASLSDLDIVAMRRLANTAISIDTVRQGNLRTAIVVSNESEELLVSLYTTVKEDKSDAVRYHVCSSLEDANTWIDDGVRP